LDGDCVSSGFEISGNIRGDFVMLKWLRFSAVVLGCIGAAEIQAADQWGLTMGTAELQSAKSLAFGPQDILFIADAKAAAIIAVATGDTEGTAATSSINVSDVEKNVAGLLQAKAVTINDLAVNPATGTAFLAVTADDAPAIIQIDGAGKMKPLSLKEVRFARVDLRDAPEDKVVGEGRRAKNNRQDSITDIAFFEGKLIVSGLRSGQSPSALRELNFPFAEADRGISVQIYHAAHGKEEDYAAMRTFVPVMIDGEPSILGAYVCTPLVRIPLKDLENTSTTVRATTVAELGNRNQPLDLITYQKDGSEFLLLSNSARGVMKIETEGLKENKGLTEPVQGGGTAGQSFTSVESLKGVMQMDKLNDKSALVLVQGESGSGSSLRTVELP
jgi:hypothetical protein